MVAHCGCGVYGMETFTKARLEHSGFGGTLCKPLWFMGYFFEFDATNKVLRCCRNGRVTDALLLEAYSVARKLLESRSSCRAIDDYSVVTEFAVSTHTIKALAENSRSSAFKELVIVAPQVHIYGLARMFSILTETSRTVHAVRTMEEAYSLLGVSTPGFTRISESAASGE